MMVISDVVGPSIPWRRSTVRLEETMLSLLRARKVCRVRYGTSNSRVARWGRSSSTTAQYRGWVGGVVAVMYETGLEICLQSRQ